MFYMNIYKLQNHFIRKITLIFFMVSVFVIAGCDNSSDKNQFELKGKAVGLDGVKFDLLTSVKPGVSDTLGQFTIKDGAFSLSGKLESPVFVSLVSSPFQYYASFWLSDGTIEVNLDTAQTVEGRKDALSPQVKGSEEQLLYESYAEKSKSLYSSLSKAVESQKAAKDSKEKQMIEAKIDSLRDILTEKSNSMNYEFIKKNNSSVVSAFLMRMIINDQYQSIDSLQFLLDNFTDNVKLSPYYESDKKELEDLAKIQPGKEAPDFTLPDMQGKDFSLSSLKGKVVLLDFWASWCKPCVASIPSMKKIYNQFKDQGFEILSVSNDSKKDAWLKCIEQNTIPWENVIDRFPQPPAPRGPAEVATLYAISYLPTTILIDKNGTIIAKNLHDKDLEEKIKSAL